MQQQIHLQEEPGHAKVSSDIRLFLVARDMCEHSKLIRYRCSDDFTNVIGIMENLAGNVVIWDAFSSMSSRNVRVVGLFVRLVLGRIFSSKRKLVRLG